MELLKQLIIWLIEKSARCVVFILKNIKLNKWRKLVRNYLLKGAPTPTLIFKLVNSIKNFWKLCGNVLIY